MHNTFWKTIRYWSGGIRFYITLGVALVSVAALMWAKAAYGNSPATTIRLQEVYAWLSVVLLGLAVLIGPLAKTFRGLPGKRLWFESRRMLGIGSAWFAALHIGIAYVGQFNAANPLSLPAAYQRAFLVGVLAFIILGAMAFTSFDSAMKRMGVWWFRLHRLVYAAVILVMLHAFLIGVHAVDWPFLISLSVAASTVLALHAYLNFVKKDQPSMLQIVTICYSFLLLLAVLAFGFTAKLGYNPIIGKGHTHQGTRQ